VIVGGSGPGTLGLLRSLSRADIPVILVDEDVFAPAMHSRHGYKVAVGQLSGVTLVKTLQALAGGLGGRAVLFLNSDDAVLTVSQHRAQLANYYRFLLPTHDCVTSLINKTSFRQLAEANGFPVPRSVTISRIVDLSRLVELKYPCILKPTRATPDYVNSKFERAYKVASREQAEKICHRILAVVPALVVQEWIEGSDDNLYFCLQYRGADGSTVCSFTGRKLSIWPPDVGVTASCTAAHEARPILQPLTEAFFDTVSFVGMGGMEFKRDARTGQFLMIEPTVGRIDGQEEVATLHGINIPAAAYLHEVGSPVCRMEEDLAPLIWQDSISHWRSLRCHRRVLEPKPGMRIYEAYWRRDDPMPAFSHLWQELVWSVLRTMRRAPFLRTLVRSLRRTSRANRQIPTSQDS
jgi:D-aspartate ligase